MSEPFADLHLDFPEKTHDINPIKIYMPPLFAVKLKYCHQLTPKQKHIMN
jgi:hypothetical protein